MARKKKDDEENEEESGGKEKGESSRSLSGHARRDFMIWIDQGKTLLFNTVHNYDLL